MFRKLILTIVLIAATPGFAQPSTADCAESISALEKVITKYKTVIKPSVTKWLVGVWKKKHNILFYGKVEITIDESTKFNFADAQMKICPQTDGTFYVYNRNNPSEYATVAIDSKSKMNVSAGNGRLANLVDLYLKIKDL
jgi:hypothetical protein